jgi:hypothetical protein
MHILLGMCTHVRPRANCTHTHAHTTHTLYKIFVENGINIGNYLESIPKSTNFVSICESGQYGVGYPWG